MNDRTIALRDAPLTPHQLDAVKKWARDVAQRLLEAHHVKDHRFQLILHPTWAGYFKARHGAPRPDTIVGSLMTKELQQIQEQGQVPRELFNIWGMNRRSRIFLGPPVCAILANALPIPEEISDPDLALAFFVLVHEAGHQLPGGRLTWFEDLKVHTDELRKWMVGPLGSRASDSPQPESASRDLGEALSIIELALQSMPELVRFPLEGLIHVLVFQALGSGELGHTLSRDALAQLVADELTFHPGRPYSLAVLLFTVLAHLGTDGDRDHALAFARRFAREPKWVFWAIEQMAALRQRNQGSDEVIKLASFSSLVQGNATSLDQSWGLGPLFALTAATCSFLDAAVYARDHDLTAGWLLGLDTGPVDPRDVVEVIEQNLALFDPLSHKEKLSEAMLGGSL